jgi:hypothetical protein
MMSTRYAIPTAVLLALALIPTTIHSYVGARATDTLTARDIPAVLQDMPSKPTARKAAWVQDTFESDDWVERIYDAGGDDVRLFAGRSYDAKRLYHHPELALLRGTETAPAGVTRASARPEIPLHLITTAREGRKGIAVYALLYDGSFVEDPVYFQLRTSAALLMSAPMPMTLFFASDLSGSASNVDEAPATRVLLAAISAFQAQLGRPVQPQQ